MTSLFSECCQNDSASTSPRRRKGILHSLIGDDRGSTTIEFVVWLPLMVALLLIGAQGAMLFMVQANYGSLARDTARMISRHAMTADDVDAYLATRAVMGGLPEASVVIADGLVTVTLSKPALEIASFDPLNLTESFRLTASVTQSLEPR
jgi:Flp pilus assembly protein TadG